MKVYSTQPLERVAYFGHEGGTAADVYLRDNIEETDIELTDGDTQKQYVADEVHLKTMLTKEDIYMIPFGTKIYDVLVKLKIYKE